MKTIVIAAGAAAMLLTAGAADAKATRHAKHHASRAAAAPPSPAQPIPYAELDNYLNASPKERASRDWWSGAA